jgi:hypothetical protein
MKTVEFDIEALPEDASVRGNAIASGDVTYDESVEDAVIADVNDGNVWAWASVRVTARIDGIECSEYLGCCSYNGRAAFERDGYCLDMKAEALSELRDEIKESWAAFKRAEKELNAERDVYEKRLGEYENWACADCDGCAVVHPEEYDEIGIPFCSDCDQEMERVDSDG